MAPRKITSHSNDSFWKIASENYDEVQKWPEWKKSIKITSATASTGKFIVIQESKSLSSNKDK